MTEFAPAVRTNTAIVLALAGASGSGKTKSALELAVGLAGERGQILMIDSEGRRGLHYAEDYGYFHHDWQPPYEPAALGALLRKAAGQFAVVIVDSMSDEHEGEGGLADMAEAELQGQIKKGWEPNSASAWARPKAQHKLHIVRWLRQAPCHIVFCLRAQERVRFETVNEGGRRRTKVVPIGWWPIAEKNLLFDVTTSLLFTPDRPGVPKPIKLYDKHAPFFPPDRQVSREAGLQLAMWAAGGAAIQASEIKNADYPARIEAGARLAERASGAAPLRAVEVDALSDASPLGETDALRADLNATAEGKAGLGSKAFRLWWKNEVTPNERKLILGYMRRYEGMAREADEKATA